MTKTPEEAHEDLAYVREAIEYQRRFVCEYLPPSLAALTALYLLAVVGSRFYLDEATGDMVGTYSTLAMVFIFVARGVYRARKKPSQIARRSISKRARMKMVMPILVMMAAILVLGVARSELGLIGDQFRIARLGHHDVT